MTLTLSPEKVGTWALREILRSAQMNKIASELVKALDGIGGGVYTLAGADLQLSTSAAKQFILDLAAKLTSGHTLTIDDAIILIQGVSGRLNLTAGAGINVFHGAAINLDGASGGAQISTEAGSLIDVFGLLKIESGGEEQIESGGELSVESGGVLQVKSGGALNLLAGALMDVLGGITMESGSLLDLLSGAILNADSGASIVMHRAQDLAISDVGGTNTGSWSSTLTAHYAETGWFQSIGASQYWQQSDASAGRRLQFDLGGILQGDQLVSVNAAVNVQAFHGGLFGFTLPKLSLFRLDTFGVRTDIATRSDQSASIGAYETQHNIFMDASNVDSGTMPHTLTGGRYYLELIGEHGTNSINDALQLLSITAFTKQRGFRAASEVG